MRFPLDENLSPRRGAPLRNAGHDVTHVHEVGLTGVDDGAVMAAAVTDDRVLVNADTE